MTETDNKHWCESQNAEKFWDWIKNRGGVAVWRSAEPTSAHRSWSAPLRDKSGELATKPHFSCGPEPERVVTDPDQILVSYDVEVRRFRVKLERRGNHIIASDEDSARIRRAVQRANDACPAGAGSFERFDYDTKEAVIYAPAKILSLTEWARQSGLEKPEQREEPLNSMAVRHGFEP